MTNNEIGTGQTGTTRSGRAVKVFEQRGLNDQDSKAARIKDVAALLWEEIDNISVPPGIDSDSMRLISIAKTNIETAVMFAVKALSRNY